MNRLSAFSHRYNSARKSVSQAWCTTIILLVAGFYWALIQLFTTVTMDCRTYYSWVTDAPAGRFNTLEAMLLLSFTMAAYFLVDVLRPKPVKRSLIIRFMQLLLVFSIVSASLINYGIVFPEGRIAPLARQIELGFAYAGIGVFAYPELEYGFEPDWFPANPVPVVSSASYFVFSPFAMKAGLLRCEVDAQVEALRNEQLLDYSNSARPIAITQPRNE